MRKALIVLEKEWLELRLQRALLLATLFLPVLITALAVTVFFVAGRFSGNFNTAGVPLPPELASLSPLELAQAIVGEKRERTLEPVLATPIRTWELLVGKALAALIPALAVTIAAAAVFVAGILAFAVSDRVRDVVVTAGWVIAVFVDTPLLALIGVALIVVLSSRVNDPRTAQQISAVLIVPVLLLLFGQLAGVIVLGPALALGIGLILALIAAFALWIATQLFQREAILTRWR